MINSSFFVRQENPDFDVSSTKDTIKSIISAHRKVVNNMNVTVTKNIGMLLLGIWLILIGLLSLMGGGSLSLHSLLDILAIAAGACILIGK